MATAARLMPALLLISLLSGAPLVVRASPAEVEPVTVRVSASEVWFPNTALERPDRGGPDLNGLPAILVAGRGVYFAASGGLGHYDPATRRLTLHAVPGAGPYFSVSSVASVGDRLWVALWQQGVVAFDPVSGRFDEPLWKDHRNVSLIQDAFTGNVWILSEKDLSSFDPVRREWRRHGAFMMSHGANSCDGSLLIDENAVWFAPHGNAGMPGGLFRYDKSSGAWTVLRPELVSGREDPGLGFAVGPLFATPTHVVVFYSIGNGFNLRAAILDKKANAWTPLVRRDMPVAFDLLARDLTRTRWSAGSGEPLFEWIDTVADRKGLPDGTHPYAFGAEELDRTGKSALALRKAMRDAGVWNLLRFGPAKAAMVNGRVLEFERPYDPPKVVAEVRPPQVTFTRLIGPTEGNRVLVDTPSGVAELALDPPALRPFDGPGIERSRDGRLCRDAETGFYLVASSDPGEGGEGEPGPSFDLMLLDPATRTVRHLASTGDASTILGTLDGRCALKAADGSYRVVDPVTGSLRDVENRSSPFAPSGGFPSRTDLPGGGAVALRHDGLVWTVPEAPHR